MKILKYFFGIILSIFLSILNLAHADLYINASGATPTVVESGNPFFFGTDFPSVFWGPSKIISIGPNAWEFQLIFAGGDYASFGSDNRGLDLIESGTGKLLNSFSFNYWYRDPSLDLVLFDAYLYTADALGNPAAESARCPANCNTAVYDGAPQLVMQGMSTAYIPSFNVYLTGTAPVNFNADPNNVPEPATLALLIIGGLGIFLNRSVNQNRRKFR